MVRSQGSPRGGQLPSTLNSSRSAIRAWSFALGVLGVKVPSWESPAIPPPLSALMAVFAGYLNDVRGNPPQTVHKKLTHMAMFSAHCRKRRRAIQRARLTDIDDFIVACRQRYALGPWQTSARRYGCSSDSYARPAVPAMICPDPCSLHYSSERATTSSSSMEGCAAHSEGRRSVKTHGSTRLRDSADDERLWARLG